MNTTASSAREVLIAARKLIEKPENRSRDLGDGHTRFCIIAALTFSSNADDRTTWDAIDALRKEIPEPHSLVMFNDNATHAEVLAAFDKAIEAAP